MRLQCRREQRLTLGEREGGWRRPSACVRALLRAHSEAHPRCDARHAKSGKQVRALIPLQPSTVVDYENCEIGEKEDASDLRVLGLLSGEQGCGNGVQFEWLFRHAFRRGGCIRGIHIPARSCVLL
jgi:hypothetical protein